MKKILVTLILTTIFLASCTYEKDYTKEFVDKINNTQIPQEYSVDYYINGGHHSWSVKNYSARISDEEIVFLEGIFDYYAPPESTQVVTIRYDSDKKIEDCNEKWNRTSYVKNEINEYVEVKNFTSTECDAFEFINLSTQEIKQKSIIKDVLEGNITSVKKTNNCYQVSWRDSVSSYRGDTLCFKDNKLIKDDGSLGNTGYTYVWHWEVTD